MAKERQQEHELEPDLAANFATTFIPRWDTYSMQVEDGNYRHVGHKDRNTGVFIPYPLTMIQVQAHFKGHLTIGAYPARCRKNR